MTEDDLEKIKQEKIEKMKKTSNSPEKPIHVDGELTEVTDDYGLVLVDFYADWCGPCKMLEPVVEEIAEETGATVVKVDIDSHPDIAQEYNVRGVPTLVIFSEGEPVERLVGVQEKDVLVNLIENYSS